jgi:hypothetical protein
MAMGSLVLGVVGRNSLVERGGGSRDCGGGDGDGEGGGTDEKLADLANVRRKETREDRDDADERGGRSPTRRLGFSDRGVTRGR